MRSLVALLALCATSFALTSAFAENSGHAKHKEHKSPDPAGVMRAHTHMKGKTMLMYMTSGTFASGVSGSRGAALANYHHIGDNMTMKMDMLGIMHGVTDNLTLGVMGGYMRMDMETESRMHGNNSHSVKGFGDTSIDAMYKLFSNETHHFQANLGLILPTGSTTKSHEMKAHHGMGMHTHEMRNGYRMQTGTGSYSLTPGVSYTHTINSKWQVSGQANATIRLNENNQGYRFGNIYNLTSWVSYELNSVSNLSARLDYTNVQAVHGTDPKISQTASPMGVPSLSYRRQLTPFIGANFKLRGAFEGTKVQLEFGSPLFQSIGNGMPKQRIIINGGLQYSF